MKTGTHNIILDKKKFIDLVLSFLQQLWDYEHKNANVFVIIQKNERVKPYFFFNNERIFEIVEKFLENVNFENEYFYQVLPLRRKPKFGRGKEKDVLVGKFLFFDLDFKNVVDKFENNELKIVEKDDHAIEGYFEYEGKVYYVKRPPLSEILRTCEEKVGKLPKFVVDSGAGYHVLFELDNYVDGKIIKKLNEIIAKLLNADLQSTDLVRIFRLPGTINKKIKRLCNIIYVGDDKIDVNELIKKHGLEEKKDSTFEETKDIKFDEKEFKELNEDEIVELVEVIKQIYKEHDRHYVILSLAGLLCKLKIHFLSAIKVVKQLCALTNDNEIVDRITAVYYTYGKYGFDVNRYIEHIKELTGVKPHGIQVFEKENIKGYTGLIELIELKYGENAKNYIAKLNEILNKINPKFDFEGYIFVDYDGVEGYLLDYKNKITYLAKKEKENIKPIKPILKAVPIKITIYNSPVEDIDNFEIQFLTNYKTIKIRAGILTDVIEEIKVHPIVVKERLLKDALHCIINYFIATNRVEIKTHNKKGFYLINGKITNIGYEIKEINIEKLRDALILLNQIVNSYNSRDKVACFIKNAILLPFGYVAKQRGGMFKYIYLFGNSKTGKTTLGKVILNIWGVPENNKSGAFVDTLARLGNVINETTFPFLINEPGNVFEKMEIVDAFKNAVENLYIRGKYTGKTYINVPALSSFIFTSNRVLLKDDALLRRFIIINFTLEDVIKDEKIKEFREKIESQFFKLREIGNAIAYLVVKENYELDSTKILRELYKRVGMDEPDWLSLDYEEEIELPLLYDEYYIFQLIKKYILDQYNKYLKTTRHMDENLGEYTSYKPLELSQMLLNLLNMDYLTGIHKKGDN
ncbi:MAG: hypothetical protein QXO40_05480, partial [Candidatus Aenigmatarchaeota archaeon]